MRFKKELTQEEIIKINETYLKVLASIRIMEIIDDEINKGAGEDE